MPLLSGSVPATSQNLPENSKVFSSLMNSNPRPSMSQTLLLEGETTPVHFEEMIRVMSFNVCCDDHVEHNWHERKNSVLSVIRFHRADLIGFQEPSLSQIDDLTNALPEYLVFAGMTMKEGETATHDAVFFRKNRFELLDSGFFFLSPTPEEPSKGWEAKFPRGTAWVKLFDKRSGKNLYFFNTHFDYHSRIARDESAQLLRKKVTEIAGREPFIVAGDFNLFPTLGGEETYQILTGSSVTREGRAFVDAQKCARFPHHGPTGTWSGFKEAGQPGIKPDYIFVDGTIAVYLHGILADSFDGKFPSDHLPVVADLAIK